jgi:putrescine transport system ATP-binding protein
VAEFGIAALSVTPVAGARTTATGKALSVVALRKTYGDVVAVDEASMEIAAGEFFTFLGASGSGKTTTLMMIAGFCEPDSGTITVGDRDVTRLAPQKRGLGFVFQQYLLFPHMTVSENVAFPLTLRGVPKDEIRRRVGETLEIAGLSGFGGRKPRELSGGQQQRVALCRALVYRPPVILMDEPLGALDKKLREETQIELVNIIHSVGVTCVMVTHDQEEAMTMTSRIAVMSEGRFLQVGSPAEIYETPATRFVADFIGNVNLMDGKVTVDEPDHVVIDCADCRHYVGHGITGTLGMPVAVALRPEKISLQRARPAGEFNAVAGTIQELSYFGATTVFRVKLASGQVLAVSMANTERHLDDAFARGDTVWASWSPQAHVVLTH